VRISGTSSVRADTVSFASKSVIIAVHPRCFDQLAYYYARRKHKLTRKLDRGGTDRIGLTHDLDLDLDL